MIGTKPTPGVGELLSLLAHAVPPSAAKLARPWALEGDTPFWLSRSSWGMAAVARAVAQRLGREARVWLPEYFCEQSLGPLRGEHTALRFYPVTERAWPDWGRMGGLEPPPDVFFLVHFYGAASDGAAARRFCDDAGALMVEDATHAVGPGPGVGEVGDFVVYSPWKFFAVPNGALMLARPRAAAWLEPVRQALAGYGHGVSPGLQWLKEAVREVVSGGQTPRGTACEAGEFFLDPTVQPMPMRPMASPVSKPVLAGADLAEAGRRRRANDAATRGFLAGAPGWAPLDPEPAHGPLRSAFRLDSPERADAAHRALRRAGLLAEGWPGLPPEVSDPQSWAQRLRRTVVNLPCHQGIAPDSLVEILRASAVVEAADRA